MRKWQDLARPDDPNVWYDVSGFAPTAYGTYENAPSGYTSQSGTATGVGTVVYAFSGKGITSTRQFAVDGSHIWEWVSSLSITDQTGGVTVGSKPMMAQYGDVTICAMGAGASTVKSTGGAFSALAGAPKGEIICVHKNAVLIFNTDTSADGWAASDVGDYTNWTTGEAANGRLIDIAGAITAAIPFGDAVYVFKANAIYRMTYVGGTVKWAFQLVSVGVGCSSTISLNSKYAVAAGQSSILFQGPVATNGANQVPIFLYDGSSKPLRVNPVTTIGADCFFTYDPIPDRFALFQSSGSGATLYFYSVPGDAWGKDAVAITGGGLIPAPILGDFAARAQADQVSWPPFFFNAGSNVLGRKGMGGTLPSPTITTSMFGRWDRKTKFTRLVPIVRRYSGNSTITVDASFYHDLQDSSAASTQLSISQSTGRKRFDFFGTDNFGRFKITYPSSAALSLEIDDVDVSTVPAGTE